MNKFWQKFKIVLTVIGGITVAVLAFLFYTKKQNKSTPSEVDKDLKKADEVRKDANDLLQKIDEVKIKTEKKTESIRTRKERRDEEANLLFPDL